ncbi:hypothetical protein [uncultured Alsobacter sp.]|uniref:hypothetical protein n=1 Tax=uncultured Alsobacter sp. TaxID=1748258 RepID=UPI0025FF1CEB|nr:hypothetical protein [uncultured Alsobacter sp.]
MEYRTRDAADRAWLRFVAAYYDGDDSAIEARFKESARGFIMVAVHDKARGHFLTFV